MKYLENKENLSIIFPRGVANKFTHGLVSNIPSEYCCGGAHSAKETNVAPLYIYNGGHGYAEIDFDGHKRYANFTSNFVKKYLEKIDFEPTPEKILAYIYAVLH